jgi:sugar lactone lactonase YvrE
MAETTTPTDQRQTRVVIRDRPEIRRVRTLAGGLARFSCPSAVAVDGVGNVIVADGDNHRIRKIAADGTVTTLAGTGEAGYKDGPGTVAEFAGIYGVAVVGEGSVIVADEENHCIRKIAADGTVTTLAGSGIYMEGDKDGPGTEARFCYPDGVAVDGSEGNVIVADHGNNSIRKIAADGTVTTLAGTGHYGNWDGPGTAAMFSHPSGVAVDGDGNIIVADSGSHRIRKIEADGTVTTLAGTGEAGYANGSGYSAMFNCPWGVAVDGVGNVIVADRDNHRIRKIAVDGTVTTLAGTGEAGYKDGPGDASRFHSPLGVAVDCEGSVIVADSRNNSVRKIYACLVPPITAAATSAAAASKGPMVAHLADLLRMLASGKHADVTFSVEGQLIRAHRNILCARSEYFDTMLGSQFREGDNAHADRSALDEREGVSTRRKRKASGTEEEDGVVRTGTRMDWNAEQPLPVEDATAPAFRAVLHFLYSNEPLFEEDSLFDQMRCAGRANARAASFTQCKSWSFWRAPCSVRPSAL